MQKMRVITCSGIPQSSKWGGSWITPKSCQIPEIGGHFCKMCTYDLLSPSSVTPGFTYRWGEFRRESENPFSQRFLSVELWESKWFSRKRKCEIQLNGGESTDSCRNLCNKWNSHNLTQNSPCCYLCIKSWSCHQGLGDTLSLLYIGRYCQKTTFLCQATQLTPIASKPEQISSQNFLSKFTKEIFDVELIIKLLFLSNW